MRMYVAAKPRAKKQEVTRLDATHFKVSVKEPPVGGKANEAVCRAVADFLNVAPSQITLVRGHTSKQKVLELKP